MIMEIFVLLLLVLVSLGSPLGATLAWLTLKKEKNLQLSILQEETKNQQFILQRENEILRNQNRDLLNRVVSGDLLTYQHLSRLTPNIVPDDYIPQDDHSEAERWAQYAQATGLGDILTEDTYVGEHDAREAVEFGIVDTAEQIDEVLGPGIK